MKSRCSFFLKFSDAVHGFVLMCLIASCGENIGMRSGSIGTDSDSQQKVVFDPAQASSANSSDSGVLAFVVDDGLGGRAHFSQNVLEVKTSASIRGFSSATNQLQSRKIQQRAVVKRGTQTIFEETFQANSKEWRFPFIEEGEHTLQFIFSLPALGIEVSSAAKTYRVDRTAPVFSSQLQVTASADDGVRSLSIELKSASGELIHCDKSWAYADSQSKERTRLLFMPQTIGAQGAGEGEGEQVAQSNQPLKSEPEIFDASRYSDTLIGTGKLSNSWQEKVFIEVTCSDQAGNAVTQVSPVYGEVVPYVFSAEPPFGKGPSIVGGAGASEALSELDSAQVVTYVKNRMLIFKPTLLKKEAAGPLSSEILERRSPYLRVVVASAPVTMLTSNMANSIFGPVAELESTGAEIFAFKDEVRYLLSEKLFPALSLASKSGVEVYVSLFEYSEDPERISLPPEFRTSEKLVLKSDDSGLEYLWNRDATSRVIAKKDAVISLRLDPKPQAFDGAALFKTPELEWSPNNQEWIGLVPETKAVDASGLFTATVKYPFERELPFRLRLKTTDRAGNVAFSSPSPVLLYSENLLSHFVQNSNCESEDGTPLAQPDLVLASVLACALPSKPAIWSVEMLAINRGAGPLKLQNRLQGSELPSSLDTPVSLSALQFLLKGGGETSLIPYKARRVSSDLDMMSSVIPGGPSVGSIQLSTADHLVPFYVDVSESEAFSPGTRFYFDAKSYDNVAGYLFNTQPGSTCYSNNAASAFVLDSRPKLQINSPSEDGISRNALKRSAFPCD